MMRARSRMMRLALVMGAFACAGSIGAQDRKPDSKQRIVFETTRDGNGEIYIMNADGSGVVNLTKNDTRDWGPACSTDGKKVAFTSNRTTTDLMTTGTRENFYELYVLRTDGTGLARLTDNDVWDEAPVWSPDGTRILCESGSSTGRSSTVGSPEIFIMSADGSGRKNLTNNEAFDEDPSWSPDGKRIVFSSNRDGNQEIYAMNADGSAQTRLTKNKASDSAPSWSPDGKRIVFVSDRDGNDEIYIMNADGSGQTNLSRNSSTERSPKWSPDGKRILFTSKRDGNLEIYAMNADGSGQTNLSKNDAVDRSPAWSPDGKRIAFASNRDGNDEIYVMNADGSGQTNLTRNDGYDGAPLWASN